MKLILQRQVYKFQYVLGVPMCHDTLIQHTIHLYGSSGASQVWAVYSQVHICQYIYPLTARSTMHIWHYIYPDHSWQSMISGASWVQRVRLIKYL